MYHIKAIPTTYVGVNFRSRLEARWAAFFDLCGWNWDYEPFDLEGWAPDFRIRTKIGPVLCEVKPADLASYIDRQIESGKSEPWPFLEYAKAGKYMQKCAVCFLGDAPLGHSHFPVGVIDSEPPCGIEFDDLFDALSPSGDTEALWREAGNLVQWQPGSRSFRRAA